MPANGLRARTDPYDLAIFGGRGGGTIAAQVFGRAAGENGGRLLGFLNDMEERGTRIGGYPVLGPFRAWRELPPTARFLAPLHKPGEMARRSGIIRELGIAREQWAALIDPAAVIADDAEHGAGFFADIWSRVMPGAKVGDHVAVRGGALVSHDCTVEDFAFIGVNAVVCGYATVREGAHVSPGAIVRDGIHVGRYSVIGLGAIVVEDVPEGATVAGNPARVIRWPDDAADGGGAARAR